MKSWLVHYKNKYPGGRVVASEAQGFLDAFDADGEQRVSVARNGAGAWVDQSAELGLPDRHDLAPIPRLARVHKLHKDGSVGVDDKHEERRKQGKAFAKNGRVQSMAELGEQGYEFQDNGDVKKAPAQEAKAE